MTARNYWLSLSFANLVYLRAWSDLIPASANDAFLRKTLAGYPLYFAIATDVLILSLLTFVVVSIAPKLPGWLRRFLPVLPLAMLAMTARSLAGDSLTAGPLLAACAGLLLIVAGAAVWFEEQARKAIGISALMAVPCLAVTFIGSPLYLTQQGRLPADPPLAKRLASMPPVRVLWIVFDDLDERLTFEDRAVGVRLPAIDDLSIRSFRTTRALAVEAGIRKLYDMSTEEAIPALLYGRRVIGAEAEDSKTERLAFVPKTGSGEADTGVFGGPGSIFHRVRQRGWNAAAAGWHLPYCRVFGSQLTDCWWDMRYIQSFSASPEYRQAAIDETRMMFETSVFSPFGAALVDEKHFALYRHLVTEGRRLAADPSIGVALIHLNVPHAPYFYEPKTGPSFRYGYQGAMYTEALRYCDDAVAEILASVRAAGLEGKTAILLSSDHPFRYSPSGDVHVPFIVHLPDDHTSVLSNGEFSAVLSADLVIAIAGGEVKSAADVAEFVKNYRRWRK